ncbi:restriction endonuclease subunit S [Maribacter dokdonensis]|uniref:restriction endonuclease subunit S n=1 Tax=Maribacter dokdonensis TaxID=320912 RepID=UPI002AAF5755|nr:restriction endonuclease subunit S [Maribacter dokdonensis]
MYGLKPHTIKSIQGVFAKYPDIDKAILFGSRAKGNYRNGSDIDLTLVGNNLTLSQQFAIETALDDLLLPYKMDLSIFHKIENQDLIDHINRVGITFYENDNAFAKAEEWEEKKLKEVAELVKNSWKVGDEHSPYIALEHIVENGLRIKGVGDSNDVASNKYRFDAETFLFGKLRPYFRKLYRPDFKGICSTDIWVVKAIEDNDKDFLFYFFANKEFIDLSYSTSSGTRMPRADWNFIKDTKWEFPPLPEQKAIANVLSSLDTKIDLLHRQNKTLEELSKTLFRQYFIEADNEEWKEEPLSSVATFLNGLACQKYPPKNEIDKLPVLKIKELKAGFTDNSDWVSTEVDEKYFVQNGDVIFSWSASLVVKIWDGEDCILNQHLFKVTSERFPKWFYYLWSKYHLDMFIAIAKAHATTMGHIKRGDLDDAMVVIPPPSELARMNKIFAPLIDKIIANNQQIKKVEKLRDTLLPKLMSGEVRVKQLNK